MSNDQLKFKVLSRLINGEAPKLIEQTMDGVGYSTILRWNRELVEARENNSIDQLIDIDKAMLGEILDEVEARTPQVFEAQAGELVDNVKKAVTAIEALQIDLVVTAKALNTRVKSLAMSAENIGELSMLADTLCALQNAFFNKNSTQVNVQNNYEGESKKYSSFLGDKPGG